jgi:hypothetical protein
MGDTEKIHLCFFFLNWKFIGMMFLRIALIFFGCSNKEHKLGGL